MNISFYNGVSGMVAFQRDMDVIAHNVANTSTIGYKPERGSFADLLRTRMATNGEQENLVGHGVKLQGTDLIVKQGPVIQSGNSLDYGIMGEGFFGIERQDGSIEYTRAGAFDIGLEGRNKGFLVTADGSFVLDMKSKPISLKKDSETGLFDLKGLGEKLGVFIVPNPYGLQPTPGGFRLTETSGEAQPADKLKDTDYTLISGALEQSAVEMADEMVNVMVAQKGFNFNAKMVQTADQVEEIINNLR